MTRIIFILAGMLLLGACSTIPEGTPLGTQANPVRANFPPGQRAYLDRLRCSDGTAPSYYRTGNYGEGPYGSIIDGYEVDCGDAAPGKVMIFMDMYHNHVEDEAVPGFTIVPARGRGGTA